MHVKSNQMQHVAMLADLGGQNSIKKLDQKERKAVQVMMEAIQNGVTDTEVSLNSNQYTELTNKLWGGIGSHKRASSFWLISFFKGLANLFGNLGSKEVSDKVNKAIKKMPPQQAAEKLRNLVTPLVNAKELTVDYYENKAPKVAVQILLNQKEEAEATKRKFQEALQAEMVKIKDQVGLSDALRVGWSCLTSQASWDNVKQAAKTLQEITQLEDAIKRHDIEKVKQIVGSDSNFGLMEAIKNHYLGMFDNLITIVKDMNQALAKEA